MKIFTLFLYTLLLFTSNPKRQIITDNFNYDFFILPTEKKQKIELTKTYTWYKNGELHTSEGYAYGNLLDGKYVKSYASGNIAEQGQFKNGLKVGMWVSWHISGIKKEVTNWDNGLLSGTIYKYNEKGEPVLKGRYMHGKKHGVWVNYKDKDSVSYNFGKVKEIKSKKNTQENNNKKHKKNKKKRKKKSLLKRLKDKSRKKKSKSKKHD